MVESTSSRSATRTGPTRYGPSTRAFSLGAGATPRRFPSRGSPREAATSPAASPPRPSAGPGSRRAFPQQRPVAPQSPLRRPRRADRIRSRDGFGDRSREAVVVLHGQPGVGKSELAREFARRQGDTYPGGRFIVEAGKQALAVDLARIGSTLLGLDMPAGMPLEDQGQRTLSALGAEPTLLIYDNVQAKDAVLPWLPPAGMPCHVLMTTTLDRWDAGWLVAWRCRRFRRPNRSTWSSASRAARWRTRYGARLAELAGGLPVQTRARVRDPGLRGAPRPPRRCVAHSGAGGRGELPRRLPAARGAGPAAAARGGAAEPAAHPARRAAAPRWRRRRLERGRVPAAARRLSRPASAARTVPSFGCTSCSPPFCSAGPQPDEVAAAPATGRSRASAADDGDCAANWPPIRTAPRWPQACWRFRPIPAAGTIEMAEISVADGETLGRALYEIGQFEAARPWFERAVAAKEQGDVHGRVDHESLGGSLHQVGYCLSQHRPVRGGAALVRARGRGKRSRATSTAASITRAWAGACTRWATACRRPASSRRRGPGSSAPSRKRSRATSTAGSITRAWAASLHQVGFCLSQHGPVRGGAALVRARRGGQASRATSTAGSITRAWAAACTRWATACRSTGQFEAARPWFERAVAEAEQGDVHGRGRSREPGQQPAPGGPLPVAARASTRRRGPGSSARWRSRSRATSTAGSITRAWA